MKLAYLANIGIADNWAHTIQIMKMCESFARTGADVTLVVAKRKHLDDPYAFYNVEPIFKIVELPYIDLFHGHPNLVLYWVRFVSFIVSVAFHTITHSYDILYTREMYLSVFFKNIVLERHSLPHHMTVVHRWIFKRAKKFVVLTSFIKDRIVGTGVSGSKILVAPDAVRLKDFEKIDLSHRATMAIPSDAYIFGYVGTLRTMGHEKGVSTAIDALKFTEPDTYLYVVGGEKQDIDFYQQYAEEKGVSEKVIFAGKVAHKDIPTYISVCNVLVAPFPFTEHYAYFMSPLKIFEYMASRRPIVATTLPSIKEILEDQRNAILVPPSDPVALAHAIERLHTDSELGQALAHNAYEEVVSKYTWDIRAKNILNFIQQ